MKKPTILLTNDDGIYSDGLKYLAETMLPIAELFIVAPAAERSGAALSLTIREPLHIEKATWEGAAGAWKMNGTPADCIRMALSVLLPKKPDLIVSGINHGHNAGKVVLYSGTVAAAIEGVNRNIQSVAFSCATEKNPNFNGFKKYIEDIVFHILADPLPKGTLLNVNFPETDKPIKGMRLARQGKSYWIEDPDERVHPEGQTYYWLGGKWIQDENHEETDVTLLQEGFAAAVPINVTELTDHDLLRSRKQVFDNLF